MRQLTFICFYSIFMPNHFVVLEFFFVYAKYKNRIATPEEAMIINISVITF